MVDATRRNLPHRRTVVVLRRRSRDRTRAILSAALIRMYIELRSSVTQTARHRSQRHIDFRRVRYIIEYPRAALFQRFSSGRPTLLFVADWSMTSHRRARD